MSGAPLEVSPWDASEERTSQPQLQPPVQQESSCSCSPEGDRACVWEPRQVWELRSRDQGLGQYGACYGWLRSGTEVELTVLGLACGVVDLVLVLAGSPGLRRGRHGGGWSSGGGRNGRMKGRRKTRQGLVLTRKWATGILACRTPKCGLYYSREYLWGERPEGSVLVDF